MKRQVVFSLTEPDPDTFVPRVSLLRLGNLHNVDLENPMKPVLEIKVRTDFRPNDPNEELTLV